MTFATLAPPTIVVEVQSPTPLPTATSTPTPTPIVYLIQEGDTLLGIAIDQRITVEEIQALNPDVRPELLSIGQPITLPPPATPVFSGEQPTPIPIQIETISIGLFPDGAGGLWVLGEVENLSDGLLQNLKLQVDLFGEGGNVVGTAQFWAADDQISPSAVSPFSIFFPQKPTGNLQTTITVVDGLVSLTADSISNLAVENLVVTHDGGVTGIAGDLVNQQPDPINEAQILLSVFSSDDQLVGFAIYEFDGDILPGESHSFRREFVAPGGLGTYAKAIANSKLKQTTIEEN
ncbi:MAG: LysM peptidoglycan-binding domain-containing protein [Chloroflexota bacterium]